MFFGSFLREKEMLQNCSCGDEELEDVPSRASGVSIMIVAVCKVSFSNMTIKRPDLTVLGPNNQANSW